MTYEFISMDDAGMQTGDYIIRLRCKPSWLQRCPYRNNTAKDPSLDQILNGENLVRITKHF